MLTQLLLPETLLNNLCLCKVDVEHYQIAGAHSLSLHRSSNAIIRHQTEKGEKSERSREKKKDIF